MVAAQLEVALNALINSGNADWKNSEELQHIQLVRLQYIALDRRNELTQLIEIPLLISNKRTIV